MTQKEFLLTWMQSHEGERFTPEALRDAVNASYKELTGRTFGDVGKAARVLKKIGRIQRSSKGDGQRYWYDGTIDTHAPLNSATKVISNDELRWREFLSREEVMVSSDWTLIGEIVASSLSGKARSKFLDSLAALLSRCGVQPPRHG